MTARVYLRRLDGAGARFGALDVSTDGATIVALRAAAVTRTLDAPPEVPAQPAGVALSVTLDAGVTLPAGTLASVEGVPGDAWRTVEAVTNGAGEARTFTVRAASVVPGARPDGGAAAGTITARVSEVSGWSAVTNAAPSTPGSYPAPERVPRGDTADLRGRLRVLTASRLDVASVPAEGARHGLAAELHRAHPSAIPGETWQPGAGETPGRWVPAPRPSLPLALQPASWAVVLPAVRADAAPLGALVFIDPAAIDGELQGAGRWWVPAEVTGGGADPLAAVRVGAIDGVPLAARAARIPLGALPPAARALALASDAVGRVRADLRPTPGGAAHGLAFRGERGGVAVVSVTLTTPADLTPPRWSSREALTLVELRAGSGEFTAV